MITYKKYLENLIAESTESDDVKGTLMEIMESAETISELDAVEIFMEEAKADDLTLKEQQDASGASTASDDGKNSNNEYELEGYEEAEEKLEKGMEQIADGDVEKGCETVGEAVSDVLKIYYGAAKKIADGADIKKDVDNIKSDSEEFKKKCKSGDITASEAKTFANKLRVRVKLIGKKVKVELGKLKKKPKTTTESALDAIFEGASDGFIPDEDLKFLIDAVTGNSDN